MTYKAYFEYDLRDDSPTFLHVVMRVNDNAGNLIFEYIGIGHIQRNPNFLPALNEFTSEKYNPMGTVIERNLLGGKASNPLYVITNPPWNVSKNKEDIAA